MTLIIMIVTPVRYSNLLRRSSQGLLPGRIDVFATHADSLGSVQERRGVVHTVMAMVL